MARAGKPLQMVSIRIYAGDIERLRKLYPSVPHNRAIREIIHKHLNRVEALYREQIGQETEITVQLDEDQSYGTKPTE